MTVMENVIKGLMVCFTRISCKGKGCPYESEYERSRLCQAHLRDDALALLKAQEPNEDWISRKHLKDEIQYYIDEAGWGDEANKVLGWCMEFIDNQMAVKWE